MNTTETYGQRLDRALKLAGKERPELARKLDISVQAVSQVINGRTVALTAENSAKAARFLNVDGYWLATGIGSPASDDNVPETQWPFTSSKADFDQLSKSQKASLDKIVGEFVAVCRERIDEWGSPPSHGVFKVPAKPEDKAI